MNGWALADMLVATFFIALGMLCLHNPNGGLIGAICYWLIAALSIVHGLKTFEKADEDDSL